MPCNRIIGETLVPHSDF